MVRAVRHVSGVGRDILPMLRMHAQKQETISQVKVGADKDWLIHLITVKRHPAGNANGKLSEPTGCKDTARHARRHEKRHKSRHPSYDEDQYTYHVPAAVRH